MLVVNQDRDKTYLVHKVQYKKHYFQGNMFGYNIYGYFLCFKVLLGTYDSESDCKQICTEIRNFKRYTMPEPYMEVEDCEIT